MGELINIENIWKDYGMDKLQEGLSSLFPSYSISLKDIFQLVLKGDIFGAMSTLLGGVTSTIANQFVGMRNILLWLIVLGIASALMNQFIEIFDKHQVADIGFYFMYLLLITVLLKCFTQVSATAGTTIESIILFIKLLVPTYILSIGVATGITTMGAYYQLLLLLIYGVENILVSGVVPLVYTYIMLSVLNGIWIEEKLTMLIELIEKAIRFILKTAVGAVTGISIFQMTITPVIDSVKSSALQKIISAIPGIGNAADSMAEFVVGSAVVIKNCIGVVMLLLLVVMCAAPLLQILLFAGVLKIAAALMGIVSDKRITACTNRVGEGSMLLFRITGTALLLFMITISIVATATNRGF